MNAFIQTINGVQEILAVCPCCGDIFRLVEGKFVFPKKQPKTCEYLELVATENKLAKEDERLFIAEEKFEENLNAQKSQLVEQGREMARKKLKAVVKKVDPIFSAKNIEPHDVKVIFDPVEYIIFHGLNSAEGVNLVEFISREPTNKTQESIVKSIDLTVRSGNVEFETLHMKDDGAFEIHKA